MKALTHTDYQFPDQVSVYHGKVRDVYDIAGRTLVMVATDRISAFDVILPEGIPYKGQVLNQIAAKFLDATTDICPNWKQAAPAPPRPPPPRHAAAHSARWSPRAYVARASRWR